MKGFAPADMEGVLEKGLFIGLGVSASSKCFVCQTLQSVPSLAVNRQAVHPT